MQKIALKWIVLTAALVIPVVVLLFLKIFGKNEFEVKPLFEDSIPARPAYCPAEVQIPYKLPSAVLTRFGLVGEAPLVLYYIGKPGRNFLQRLSGAFSEKEVKLVVIADDNTESVPASSRIVMPKDSILFYNTCYFFLPEQKYAVLVDSTARIRGYYGSTREETDKLLMEVSIILKKY
jgi:hypothetical protein